MMILIEGANGSGKSAFAETLVTDWPGDRYYIATMVAETAQNRERIKKHREAFYRQQRRRSSAEIHRLGSSFLCL